MKAPLLTAIILTTYGNLNVVAQETKVPEPKAHAQLIVEGVPPLAWGRSGENSFCGALSSALNGMHIQRTYPMLMGDSAMSFRTRWWVPNEGNGWCPTSGMGEFSPWDRRAADSVGVELKYVVHIGEKKDMADYAGNVADSINAGRPVLVYGKEMDMGVIYACDPSGKTVSIRDYYLGQKEFTIPLSQTRELLCFLTPKGKPPTDIDLAAIGINAAVADWNADPMDFTSRNRQGKYLLGDAAYARWISDLQRADDLPAADREKMFHPNWWTFDLLADARRTAVTYLKTIAPNFAPEPRAAIERAAAEYEKSAKALGTAFENKNAFLGPWSGKKIDDWTKEVLAEEIRILTEARAHDAAAIKELKEAAKHF